MVCRTCELVKDIIQVGQAIAGAASGRAPGSWVNLLAPGGPLAPPGIEDAGDDWARELREVIFPPGQGSGILSSAPGGGQLFSYQPESQEKPKKKAKVSRYHRALGKHLEKLKKKHPRTAQKQLMKRAHAATKKQRKAEGW